jgi:hypothetical protein
VKMMRRINLMQAGRVGLSVVAQKNENPLGF